MAIVKFYQTTSTKFNTASKDENALYFLTDTKQIYKGSVLYAEDFTGDISYISGIVGGNVNDIAFLSGTILSGFTASNTVKDAIEAVQNAAINISGSDLISVTGEGTAKSIDLTLASNKILAKTDTGLSAAVSLAKLGTANEGYAASYKLVGIDGTQLGDTINIPKDQFLKDAEFISSALADDVTASNNTVTLGKPCIKFTFEIKVKDDATGAETSTDKFVYVDVKNLVDTYTAGVGITLTSNEFSITKNGNNDDQFLVIGVDGIGLSGITAAITEAVEAEKTLRISADAFLSGQIDTLASSTESEEGDAFLSGEIVKGDQFLSGAIIDGDQFLSGKVGDANNGIAYVSGIVKENATASENGEKYLSGILSGKADLTDVIAGDQFLSGKVGDANNGIAYVSGIVKENATASENGEKFLSGAVVDGDQYLSATLVGFNTTTTVSSVIESIRTSAISITGVSGISVTGDGTAKTASAVVKSTDKVLGVDADGLFTSVSLVKLGTATEGYAASYKLVGKDGTTALGDTINIPKDQFLTDAEFIPSASAADETASSSEVKEGDPCIKFTFAVKDEVEETTVAKVVYVNVKDLVDTYTAGNGLTLTGNDFSITKNGNNDDRFLVIGTDGIGLSGITAAITTAVSSEATLRESADAFLSTQIGSNDTEIANLKAADAFISGQIPSIAAAASGNVATNYIGGTYGNGITVAEDIASIKGAMISGTTTDTLKHVALINATANEVTYSTANIGGNEIALSGTGDIQDKVWNSGTSALNGDTVNNTELLATEEAVVKYVKDMLTWKELS